MSLEVIAFQALFILGLIIARLYGKLPMLLLAAGSIAFTLKIAHTSELAGLQLFTIVVTSAILFNIGNNKKTLQKRRKKKTSRMNKEESVRNILRKQNKRFFSDN